MFELREEQGVYFVLITTDVDKNRRFRIALFGHCD